MQVLDITNLTQLDDVAKQLTGEITHPAWVYLVGDLGTGKTTFTQRFIHHKGCQERVTSPTYAILQDYSTDSGCVIHCDLYRLADPEELFEIGLLEESVENDAITLVEWASKGKGVLPQPDITLTFELHGHQRQLCIQHHNTSNIS